MARITTLDQAHAELADALWWLRGFEAGTTSEHDGTVHDLWTGLRQVRHFLDALSAGSIRRLGSERAVVLTYAEFEVMFDACRGVPADADRSAGELTARRVLDQYRAEARVARDGLEVAF